MKIIPSIKKEDSFYQNVNLTKVIEDGSTKMIVANLVYERGELHLVTREKLADRDNDFDDEGEEIKISGVSSSEQFIAINPMFVSGGFSSSGVSTYKYFIPEMLINTNGEIVEYDKCSFELSNFPLWLGIKKLLNGNVEEPNIFLKVNQIEELKYDFKHNEEIITLRFNPIFNTAENDFENMAIQYKTLIHIEPPTPKNKMWFNEMIQKTADLFTLLIGAPLEVTYQNFYIGNMPKIDYYRKGFSYDKHEDLKYHMQILFTYNSIHEQLPMIIENWFNVANVKSTYNVIRLLISNFYLKQYEESIFLNYMQGIEGFHRLFYGGGYIDERAYKKDRKRIEEFIETEMESWDTKLKKAVKERMIYGYEYSLGYRLEQLLEPLDTKLKKLFFNDEDVEDFIKEVKGLRNQLTHPNPKKENVVKTRQLSDINTQLRILFMVFIYLELGIPNSDIINALTTSTRYRNQLSNYKKERTPFN